MDFEVIAFNNGGYSTNNSTSGRITLYPSHEAPKDENDVKEFTLCVLRVPSFMIPVELINYFNSYIKDISTMEIFRYDENEDNLSTFDTEELIDSDNNNSRYLVLIRLRSLEVCKEFVRDFDGNILTTIEPCICALRFVKAIEQDEASTSSSSSSTVSSKTMKNKGERDRNIHKSISEDKATLSGFQAFNEQCPFCLENLTSNIFRTCCNHSFHIACVSKLVGPQCPVCRFQHDLDDSYLSQCSICGHNGIAITDTNHSRGQQLRHETHGAFTNHQDLWLCLVCGFLGCGSSHCYHIKQHYNDHLHAYAMNVGNGRVWDFAGDGFVHRLVLSNNPSSEVNLQDLDAPNADINETIDTNIVSHDNEMMSRQENCGVDEMDQYTTSGSSLATSLGEPRGQSQLQSEAQAKRHMNDSSILGDPHLSATTAVPVRRGGSGGAANHNRQHRMKVVEIVPSGHLSSGGDASHSDLEATTSITGANNRSGTRDQVWASFITPAENYIIGTKLETAAQYYNRQLTQRLEVNRERYEARLRIARDHLFAFLDNHANRGISSSSLSILASSSSTLSTASSTFTETSQARLNEWRGPGTQVNNGNGLSEELTSTSYAGPSYTQSLIKSLLKEKDRLLRQVQTAQEHREHAKKSASILQNLNDTLNFNLGAWHEKESLEKVEVMEAEAKYRTSISNLDNRLRSLYEELK